MSSVPQETVVNVDSPKQACPIRVLLIAEHASTAVTLRAVFEPHSDIDFVHCADASNALKAAGRLRHTVVLLDLQTPENGSLSLVRQLRATVDFGDMPIVVLAAKGNSAGRDTVFSAGANDYLDRSAGEIEIIARVKYHSRSYEAHRQLQQVTDELEKAHDQLYQSEKMSSIGVLAAGVAHEINNPIAFVTSNLNSLGQYFQDVFKVFDAYAEIEKNTLAESADFKPVIEMKRRLKMDAVRADVEDILAECKDGLGRVRKIVDDLKNFSRTGEAEWLWADVHEELERTLSIASNEIKYKAEVVKHYGNLPKIQCIPSQLNQVFLNLLVNAAQAIQDRGEIRIRTMAGALPPDLGLEAVGRDEWVCVQVSDNGSGIDVATLERIFEPFFTTKGVGKGTGLGLSISCGIIKSHNGSITAESRPGKGTTFTIWLPVRQSDD